MQIVANIPERYAGVLKEGQKASIILEAYPTEEFVATVTDVSPVIDSTSRTKQIILKFDKRDSRINAGMFAKVKLYTQDYSGAIVVPTDAIVEKNDKKNLYIVTDGVAHLREVALGNTVDDYIQVVSGVFEGEKIVVEGMRVLSDGSPVKDLSDTKTSNEAKRN